MTEIQNSKQLAFDLIWDLDIVIWNLFVIWCLSFVISGLSELDNCSSGFGIDNCPAGAIFSERSLAKSLVPNLLESHHVCTWFMPLSTIQNNRPPTHSAPCPSRLHPTLKWTLDNRWQWHAEQWILDALSSVFVCRHSYENQAGPRN